MATQLEIDYALMAGRGYQTNRDTNNWFPIPRWWTEFFHVPSPDIPTVSGFEAVSFQRGNEIVISFAGTDRKDVTGDWLTNYALAKGNFDMQLYEAAKYYLRVKAGNPNADITFTGHSLGGGLAALMGVFFNKKAVTFDQAPFALSATSQMRDLLVSSLEYYGSYTDAQLRTLAPELFTYTTLSRTGNVSGYFVVGEALTPVHGITIGSQNPRPHGPASLLSGWDLHSQSLLAAFLSNDQFRQVTYKLTDLINMLFDGQLYYHDPTDMASPQENFLERLIRYQFGNAPGATDCDMLTRFTADLNRIAKDGGLTLTNRYVSNAMTAFAMQMYYIGRSATDATKTLFSEVSGGINFERGDIADTLGDVKGYTKYFKKYLDTSLSKDEQKVVSEKLPDVVDWYVQAGSGGMSATAGDDSAFMLGGDREDHLTGGDGDDVLVGGQGEDHINGGAGDDVICGGWATDILQGGPGDDLYVGQRFPDASGASGQLDWFIIKSGEGDDTIDDDNGNIRFAGRCLNNVQATKKEGESAYKESEDNPYSYYWNGDGTDLLITRLGHHVHDGRNNVPRFDDVTLRD